MEIETARLLSRAAAGVGWLAFCLPLLAGSLLVSGGTGTPAPFVFALVATALVATAGVARRGRRYALAAAGGLFLVLASAGFDTARVESEDDLEHARFGLPFEYVEAELGISPPFPYKASWNPLEDPARLLTLRFLAAAASVVLLALIAVGSSRALLRRRPT